MDPSPTYTTSRDANAASKPELPISDAQNPEEWVESASLAKDGTRYNDLESAYVAKHAPKVIEAIRKFIGSPIPGAVEDDPEFQ